MTQTARTSAGHAGLTVGQRINHIGQRDAVAPRKPAEGTVTGFTVNGFTQAVTVLVRWDHEGDDAYRPADLAPAQ